MARKVLLLLLLLCAPWLRRCAAARRENIDTQNECPVTVEFYDTATRGSDSFPGYVFITTESVAKSGARVERGSCTVIFENKGAVETHVLKPTGKLAEKWEGGEIAPGEKIKLLVDAEWKDGVYRYQCETDGHAWFAETSAIVISPTGAVVARNFFSASPFQRCEGVAAGNYWTDEKELGLRVEWWGALSSLAALLLGLLGVQRSQPHTPAIIRLAYVAMSIFGFTSLCYHATFAYGFALFDAYATTLLLCLTMAATYDAVAVALSELVLAKCVHRDGKRMSRLWSVARLLTQFGVVGFSATLVSLAAGNEQSYQIGFALAVAVLLLGTVLLLLHAALFETFLPLADASVLVRPHSTTARVYCTGFSTVLCGVAALAFWTTDYSCEAVPDLVEGWKAPAHGFWHIFFTLFVNWLLAWLQLSSPHGNETMLVDVRWWPSLGYGCCCGCVPLTFTFHAAESKGSQSFSVMLDQDEENRCFAGCSNLTLFGVDEEKMV